MTNSQNATTTTCFSSFLRRLVCAGGLPTHPSSDTHNPKEQTTNSLIKLQPPSPTTTPAGVVARLMGLDTFPNSPNATKVSLGSIMRKSRSVSSVDFLPNFDIIKQPHHRRVTTSLSFREVPTTSTFLHDIGKPELGLTPIQENSMSLSKKKKNIIKKLQKQSQRVNVAKKKVVDEKVYVKEEKKKYKSRKRIYNHLLPKMGKHDRKEKKKLMLKKRKSEYSEEYCIKVLDEVLRLTMVGIERGVWLDTKVVHNLQEISYEITKDILQVLVNEIVDELCKS